MLRIFSDFEYIVMNNVDKSIYILGDKMVIKSILRRRMLWDGVKCYGE